MIEKKKKLRFLIQVYTTTRLIIFFVVVVVGGNNRRKHFDISLNIEREREVDLCRPFFFKVHNKR